MPVVRIQIAFDILVPPPFVSLTGSGVSPGSLLEDGIIQRKISHQPLQPGIFLLQFPQPPGLFHPHATVLSAPAVVGLFGDTDLSAGFSNRTTLADQDFSLTKLVDDLLRFE